MGLLRDDLMVRMMAILTVTKLEIPSVIHLEINLEQKLEKR